MPLKRSVAALLVLSLVLSLAIPIIYGGLDSFRQLDRLPGWGLLLLLGMISLGWVCNGARLCLLGHHLGIRLRLHSGFATTVASEFAGSATPASSGAPATSLLLLSQHGLHASRGLALIAIDALADLIFFLTAIPIAVLFLLSQREINNPWLFIGLLAVLGISGAVTLWIGARKHRAILRWLSHKTRHVKRLQPLRFRLARWVVRFRQALVVLLRLPAWKLLLLYAFTAGHWLLRYSVLAVLLWMLGESVPWAYLFLIQAALLFGGQMLFLPGGGGTVELGFAALLSGYLDPATSAFTLLVWRFCVFYWYLLFGAPIFLYLTGRAARRLLA